MYPGTVGKKIFDDEEKDMGNTLMNLIAVRNFSDCQKIEFKKV